MERPARDVGSVGLRHPGGDIVHQRGIVKGELRLAVEVEGHLSRNPVLGEGEHPAGARLIPFRSRGDGLVRQHFADLGFDAVRGDLLGAVKLEAALENGLKVGGEGVGFGGLAAVYGEGQLLGGALPGEGEFGAEAVSLGAGHPDDAALLEEYGIGQRGVEGIGRGHTDIGVSGGCREGEGQLAGGFGRGGVDNREGGELDRFFLPVHRDGEGLAAQLVAQDGEVGLAVFKGHFHFGLAVVLKGCAVYGEFGRFRGFAQEAAAVQGGVVFELLLGQDPVIDPDRVDLRLGFVAFPAAAAAQDDLLRGCLAGELRLGHLLAVRVPDALLFGKAGGNGAGDADRVFKAGLHPGGGALLELHRLAGGPGEDAPGVGAFFHRQDGGEGPVVAAVAFVADKVFDGVLAAVDGRGGLFGQEDLAAVQLQSLAGEDAGVFTAGFRKGIGLFGFPVHRGGAVCGLRQGAGGVGRKAFAVSRKAVAAVRRAVGNAFRGFIRFAGREGLLLLRFSGGVDEDLLIRIGEVCPGSGFLIRSLQPVQPQHQAVGDVILRHRVQITAQGDGLRAV